MIRKVFKRKNAQFQREMTNEAMKKCLFNVNNNKGSEEKFLRKKKSKENGSDLWYQCSFGEFLYNEMWHLYSKTCDYSTDKIFEALWHFFKMERFHLLIHDKYAALSNYKNRIKCRNIKCNMVKNNYYEDMGFRKNELILYLNSIPDHMKKEYIAVLGLVKLINDPRKKAHQFSGTVSY